MTKKVLLGMSGGVDSSVSAVLLREQGYEVIGGFMKNWSDEAQEGERDDCGWRAERRDALRVASQLDIPFFTFDFEAEYREKVYAYMIREYQAGRTPNPDVLCNKYMKFDLFMRAADELGCAYVATGHYARIFRDTQGISHLLEGRDKNKDQSYFLCQLTQSQVSRALFPVGELEKPEVRAIARRHGLIVAEKKDSQGICFVGKVALRNFLGERIAEHEGNIVTTKGEILGKHRGYEFYTIGQREGLGVGGRSGGGGEPLYVVERRAETNEVVVAVGDNDPALFRCVLKIGSLTEVYEGALCAHEGAHISARIRYRQPLSSCVYRILSEDLLEVVFSEPQRAPAPGQFCALYNNDELLGSGTILAE